MKDKLKFAWELVRDTYLEFIDDNASRLAAAIAFYAVFSVAPLFVIVIGLAGLVFGDQVARAEVADYLQQFLGPDMREFVLQLVERWQDKGSGILATAIGLATLIWGAYRLFIALQDTLNMIWNVRQKRKLSIKSWIVSRLMPFSMVIIIGLLLLVSLLASATLSTVNEFFSHILPVPPILLSGTNFLVSLALITVLFASIFKVLPDVEIAWRDVWVGAGLTSLLFVIGKSLIGFYLGHTSTTSIFGAAGSLVALLFWVYFSAQIFFVGAEFTQVFSRKKGQTIRPDKNAVRIVRHADEAVDASAQEEPDEEASTKKSPEASPA